MNAIERVIHSGTHYTNPYDVLYDVDAELGTLAYHNRDRILTSELLKYATCWRALELQEKVALCQEMTKRIGYQAEVTKHQMSTEASVDIHTVGEITKRRSIDATKDMAYMVETTKRRGIDASKNMAYMVEATKRRSIDASRDVALMVETTKRRGIDADLKVNERKHISLESICRTTETELTKRESIRTQGAVDLHRLQYEAQCRIIQQQTETERYISNNELKARVLEAEAHYNAIRACEDARRDAQIGVARADMEARTREAEFMYLSKLAQAEVLRAGESYKAKTKIIESYLHSHAALFRDSTELEKVRLIEESKVHQKSYETVQLCIKEGFNYLQNSNDTCVEISGHTVHGPINVKIQSRK